MISESREYHATDGNEVKAQF